MTKAKQIMALYDGKRSCREIADIVGCGDSYVRVVARQRKGGTLSKYDIGYIENVINRGDRAKARSQYRDVYRSAKRQGKTVKEAHGLAVRSYFRVLRETGKVARDQVSGGKGMTYHNLARIEALWRAGLDTYGIAKDLNVKESVIDDYLHEFILKTRHPRWQDKRYPSEASALETGKSSASQATA